MSLKKLMKGVPADRLSAEGLMTRDEDAITPCQAKCIDRFGKTIQIEQNNYLLKHPEVKGMLEIFISKMVHKNKRKEILRDAADHFTRSFEELEKEVIERLKVPSKKLKLQKQVLRSLECFFICLKKPTEYGRGWGGGMSSNNCYGPPLQARDPPNVPPLYIDTDVKDDIRALIMNHYQMEPMKFPSPSATTLNTESSSFLSIRTSETTLSTPEPMPTPEPTLSETLFSFISNTVDKAIFLRIDDTALNYDTAYIELQKAVERSMDIPVTEIKKDIANLFNDAYEMFEFKIMDRERIAAEIAWEKRMRKKLKRTLRRMDNFKGYETPPTPKSEISSHESYKIPPPHPCICHPQFNFNRYPKDRFGIYLPREEKFSTRNITVTPAISGSSTDEHNDRISTLS